MKYYKTVKQQGSKEVIIKKSRFIGHSKPVSTEEEAIQFIAEINKSHTSASHNCFAYVVGERDQFQKQSDDGEPSGTAGKPIMEVIKNQNLKNIAIVVTRYYGGIMLGAGGLIRAYTDGAVAGIEAGEPLYQVLHQEVKIEIDYTWWGKIENELRAQKVLVSDTEFTDQVIVFCLPIASEVDHFMSWLTELTQGQGKLTLGDNKFIPHYSIEEDNHAF